MLNKQQGSELLFNINEYEYPRANETLRNIHIQLWQEYYACLRKAYNEIGSERTMYPIALQILEGTFVKLKCQICISPIEMYISDNIEWYFNNSINNEANKLIQESDNKFISPEDGTLMIYNIKFEQAGQYWCKLRDMLSVSYYVSIDTDLKGVKTVYPSIAPNMPHAVAQTIITEYNLNIYTTWTKWSPCSKCNVVGKKIRYGYCTISSRENLIKKNIITGNKQLQDHKQQNDQNETMKGETQNQAINESVNNKIRMVLHVFRNKVPCKSKYLPKEVLNIPEIRHRKTEMMIRYCKAIFNIIKTEIFFIMCTQGNIFEVRDKNGNVLESANNSAGVYSMVQGMPALSPPIIRTTVYHKYNEKAILVCPGISNTDTPINWKIDNKMLNPFVIKDQSAGRVFINAQMHIIFKSLKFEDTNIYSCWQKDEIMGVIKLKITGEIELQTNYSIIMVGGMLIIIVFIVVFWRAFLGRKRYTIH
ncbi:Ig-like V-type domain-containing protein FAM187A [Xylocopa sonorina]|uniref:Ig-like V-type domain-containing protein FAM187A n=1 Tax=Xylocopa sonorina TaxID=1818115 RepID=UPI00403AF8E0